MSLLYREQNEKTIPVTEECYKDLAIDELIEAITSNTESQKIVKKIFQNIPDSYESVQYRQDVLKDFLANEEMCIKLEDVLSKLKALKEYGNSFRVGGLEKASIWDLIDFLQELEVYVGMIEGISDIFKKNVVSSVALKQVSNRIDKIVEGGGISRIKEDINTLRTDVSITKSLNLGINLSPDLYPQEVKILGFSNRPYNIDYRDYAGQMTHGTNVYEREAIMKCMTREIEKTLSTCVRKMKKVFKQYVDMDGYFLIDLYEELRYYILIARFYRKLQKNGYTVCMPELSSDAKDITITSLYNVRLALQENKSIVKNIFSFTEKEKLYVLTGPNRGGKTILTQGIGLAAYMASIGLFVAADSYQGYVIKKILTHFPADENKTADYGRLGEEAVRIQQIVRDSDSSTLILLNETYSTTCASDGLYLAKDLLHVLKQKNIATVFNTHILELARVTSEMNTWDGKSDIVSIVMKMENNENTFKVEKSEPNASSYARKIAEKYGITYEQMMER